MSDGGDTMSDATIDIKIDDTGIDSGRPKKIKKKKKFILPIVIIAIVALLVAIIKFDVGKISSKYIAPIVKDIPIVKNILPKTKGEEGQYADLSKTQLTNILNGSEQQLEMAQNEIQQYLLEIEALESKIEDLKVFEDEYVTFKEEKLLFDQQLATMNEDQFIAFFEQMYPDHAATIYSELIQTQQMTKEQRKYSSLISEMDESAAAKVLENLYQTDMDIILSILTNMETENVSAILEEMDSNIASIVVKQLSPQ